MIATKLDFNVLVIEDNYGDFELIEDYLSEGFNSIGVHHSDTFRKTRELLCTGEKIDIILLDLQLPDLSGSELVDEVKKLANDVPIIALTGHSRSYATKLLTTGVSDYLLKDELTPFQLHKSITYCLERNVYLKKLKDSEEKYKKIFQHGPVPKWIYDLETLAFLDVNEAAIIHYGYSRDEFLNMTIADIRPQDDLQRLAEVIQHVSQNHELTRGNYRHIKKDGDIIDVQIDGNEIEFEGKRARLVVSLDITSRLVSERALAASEKRFKYLVQEGGDLIFIMDASGQLKYSSPNHIAIVGHTAEELIGKNIVNYVHRDDRTEIVRLYRELRDQKQVVSKPFRFCHANGSYVWLESIASNTMGDPIINGYLINSRDVTARVENEKKIEEANERFEAVAKATSDAIYSYDFSTKAINISGSSYHTMFGHEFEDDMTSMNFFIESLHPDDVGRVLDFFKHAALSPQLNQFEIEYRMRRTDGSYADILDRFNISWKHGVPVKKIGAMQDVSMKNHQERILAFEKSIYELNADPKVTFKEVMDQLVVNFEQLLPLSHCSISLLREDETIEHLAGNSIDQNYIKTLNGKKTGRLAGSYSQKLMRGKTIFIQDIEKDPECVAFANVILPFGYRACWVSPVTKRNNKVIASFSAHFKETREPKDHEIKLLERVTNLVLVLIENRDALEETAQAKERYDIVSKATSDTIWDWKIQEDDFAWNRGIQGIFGYERDEIGTTSKWWFDRIHPEDSIRVSVRLYSFLEEKLEKWQDEYRFACADGTYRHIYDRGFLVKDKDGRPVRMIAAMQDVTKQKQEEQRLKLLETVVTQTKDSVIITEAEKINNSVPKVVFVNPAFTQMTGFLPEDVVGKSPSIFMGRKSVAGEITKLSQALKFKKEFKFETINHKKNGEEYWVNFSMIPITNKDGEHSHWISIQRDITTEKRQEKEKEQLIQELTQNNKDLKQFSYITSHNLRAPLSNLIGLLNLIEDIPVEHEELNEIINGFSKSTHLLNETINDLVKVVIIKDNPSIEKEEVSIKEVFENVFNQLSFLIGLHKPIIKIELKKLTLISMNKAYLESILLNLLTNAIKYRSPNRQLRINISSKEVGSNTILIFKDNGIGIDLVRNADKIFGLYQRFHNYPDSKGLGLYLVKSQVETMGGTIAVQSEVNKGTTFTLTFKNR